MDTTSVSASSPVQPVREASEGGENGPFLSSILTHEVKSVPKPLGHGENSDLDKRLAQAGAHVKEARNFLPYVAARDPERAEKLASCGSWLLYRQYLETGDCRLASGIFCQQPLLCGFCAAGRAGRQVASISEKFEHVLEAHPFQRPYMVTLTIRSQAQLASMVGQFWRSWSTMIQRRRNALKGKSASVMGLMDGGVISGEAKRGKGGQWHYHGHGVFLADLDTYASTQTALTREWAAVNGQSSASVQFVPVKSGGTLDAIREAVKYASKWEPGEYADRWDAFQTLAGVRRVRAFGLMYGVKLPEEVADDLSDKEAEEYIERAFRFGADGYFEIPLPRREPAFDEWNQEL